MKVLITGIAGMLGRHLARAALARGWQVAGLDRDAGQVPLPPLLRAGLLTGDILDRDFLNDALAGQKPDIVIHLAAQSFNNLSWQMEELTHNTNFFGTLNILQACRRSVPKAKVLLAGSSVQYGRLRPEDCPVPEDAPLRPVSPYGVSKAAGEQTGYQYCANFGQAVYLPRFFALLGAGHTPNTVVQSFARQLALIAKKKAPPRMRTGNLDSYRDFLDARDGTLGILTLLEKGKPGEPVNICSGEPVQVAEVLRRLIAVSGQKVKVSLDPALKRQSDEPFITGDNRRLRALGWKPRYKLDETLALIYGDWMKRV